MAEPSDRRSAPTVFGVHAGLQLTDTTTLRALWRRIEELGFGWISIWDHFYAANASDDAECLEAVATHAALACDTSSVRCGSLVYSVGYRHPAVLANAICTIDQLSGGRADLGLGAGWSQIEYQAYGIPFPPVKVRMDMLEECIQCVRGLLRDEVTTFEGTYFQLHEARCEPKPVQAELPIWVGGQGERRTLRIAARWADAVNVPFVDEATFAHKRDGAPRPLRRRRPRPGRAAHRGEPGPGLDRGEPPAAVRGHGRLRPARACSPAPTPRWSIASAATSRPAPTR